MTFIKFNGVNVDLASGGLFRTKSILRDISFSVNDGDRLALIGPNGAGKSTLLQTIAGVLHCSGGTIEVQGRVSALFNLSLGLRRKSTGRRNILLRSMIEKIPPEEMDQHIQRIIEFADIGEAIDDPMDTYSQGMAMRVIFAAATEFSPQILLLDEWLGVGDAAFRDKSEKRMQELLANSGLIVLATHHQRLSREICNKGLYIKEGKVRYFGTVDQAWDAYISDGLNRAPVGLQNARPASE